MSGWQHTIPRRDLDHKVTPTPPAYPRKAVCATCGAAIYRGYTGVHSEQERAYRRLP